MRYRVKTHTMAVFNYNGEKHGLRDRENQKHWTVHMAEFFDHHLRGAAKPEWMEKGVPFLERGKCDLTEVYGPRKQGTTEGLPEVRKH